MKQIIFAALLVTSVVLVVKGYNFDNPHYNEALADYLHVFYELDSPRPHFTKCRNGEAVNVEKWKKYCCVIPSFCDIRKKKDAFMQECFKEISQRNGNEPKHEDLRFYDPLRFDKVDKYRKDITCLIQCQGQKLNLLDKEGNLIESKLLPIFQEIYATESWTRSLLQDKVIPWCLAEVRNASASRNSSNTGSCNPIGINLKYCVFRELQLYCPADQIGDQKACKMLKDLRP